MMEDRLFNTVKELVGCGKVATVQDVMERVGYVQMNQSSRVLAYLQDIQARVEMYSSMYFARHAVVCLGDLELGVCEMLRKACVRPLDKVLELNGADPSEIPLDEDDEDSDEEEWDTFQELGIGPMQGYPYVASRFPHPVKRKDVSQQMILQELVKFNNKNGTHATFKKVLKQKFQCDNLVRDVGVFIDTERLCMYKSMQMMIEQQFQASFAVAHSSTSVGYQEPERPKKTKKKVIYSGSVPKLSRDKASAECFKLVKDCEDGLESAFSPSFSKLQKIIKTKVKPSQEMLLVIATEYTMLHLGSSKYRSKKFELQIEERTLEEEIEQPATIEETQASTSSSSSSSSLKKRSREVFEATLPHLRSTETVLEIGNEALKPYLPHLPSLDIQDNRQIGRWGEALVYQYLLGTMGSNWEIKWMNENDETKASYDIHAICKETKSYKSSKFIEVKSSKYPDKNVFEMSLMEWEFMSKHGGGNIHYPIYRINCAGDPDRVNIQVIENPLKLLQEQKIHLCLGI